MAPPDFDTLLLDFGNLPVPAPDLTSFDCSIISPMFMFGADKGAPQLREESFIGAMHYWYRALWGHCKPISQIKKEERELFGSTGGKGRMKLKLNNAKNLQTQEEVSFKPHRDKHRTNSKPAFKSGDFIVEMPTEFADLFELSCILGGFGGRSRRGFGSIMIKGRNTESNFPGYLCDALEKYIGKDTFRVDKFGETDIDVIKFPVNEELRDNKFPFIKNIYFGTYDFAKLDTALYDINEPTSSLKNRYGNSYGYQMGSGMPRLASPIIASVVREGENFLLLATQLHLPGSGRKNIQEEYIKDVLAPQN